MVLIIEILLTIRAWRKGWKAWALMPLGIGVLMGFFVGVAAGAGGGTNDESNLINEREVELARRIPPKDTRACGRGTAIKEVANVANSYANWLIVEGGNRSAKFDDCLDTTCSWQITPVAQKNETRKR